MTYDEIIEKEGPFCDYCPVGEDIQLDPQNPVCEGRWCQEAVDNFCDDEGVTLDDLT